MSTGAICGGAESWRRSIHRCTVCKRNTRHIHGVVYGGYGSNDICLACGALVTDLECLHKGTKEERERRMQMAKAIWDDRVRYPQLTLRAYLQKYVHGPMEEAQAEMKGATQVRP